MIDDLVRATLCSIEDHPYLTIAAIVVIVLACAFTP